jgi:hypothetical protein
MTILFVLSVVISLIVWILTFNAFFDTTELTFSFVVAVAIAIIAAGVIYAMAKRRLTPLFASIASLIVGLITAGVLFTVSAITPPRVCQQPNPTVEINCSRPITVEPREKPCLNHGQTITWTLKDSDFTFKIHEFKSTRFERPWKDDQPLTEKSYTGGKNIDAKGQPRTDKSGVFKYSITCYPSNGSPYTKDPMIDIPKSR